MNANRIYETSAKALRRFLEWSVSNPWKTLSFAVVATALLGYWGFQIPLRTNLEDLFPETTPHVVRAKATRDRMASSTQVLMVVTSPDGDANLRFVVDMADRLRSSPLISSVEYKKDVSFFKKNAFLFIDKAELLDLDQKLQRAIKKAVAKDLDPFADTEEDAPATPGKAGSVGFDDGFGDPPDAPVAKDPTPGKAAGFDDGFGDPPDAPVAKDPTPGKAAGFDDGFGDPPDAPAKAVEFDDGFGDPADRAKPAKGVAHTGAAAGPTEEATAGEQDDGFALPTEQEVKEKYGLASFSEYEQSVDGTVIAFHIYPSFSPSDVAKSRELLSYINSAIDEMNLASYNADMEYALEGDYHKKIEEIDVLYSDLAYSTISALLLILGMISFFFRRPRIVLFAFLPLVAGLSWTLGFAYAFMGYLNLITAFIFGVLSGLGVEYSMHVVGRYIEERRRGLAPPDAAVEALVKLSRAMVGSVIMTSCGFLALMVFDFRGFSQFGAIAGVGIPLCLFVVYLFFPPMVVIFNRIWAEKPYPVQAANANSATLFGSRRRAIAVLCAVGVVAAIMLPGIAKVDFEPNMKKVMTPSTENQRAEVMKKYRKQVSKASASPVALLTGSCEETKVVHEYLRDNQANYSRLESFTSPYTFVPEDQQGKKEIVDRMRERLQRKLGALKGKDLEDAKEAMPYLSPQPFTVDELPDWVKKKFTDRDGNFGTFLVLGARGNKANAFDVGEITKELDDIIVAGTTYHTSASYYILKDVYDIVRQEGPMALLLAALAALITVILDFRKLSEALIAFFPVLLGVGCFVGFMGWMGENFTMFNMIILPSVFGTSIDTCTHVLHRLREEGPENAGLIANTTGAATFLGAMTNTFGFGTLVVATNPGLANIGKLAPIGLLTCWILCLTVSLSFGYLRGIWEGKRRNA